MKKNDILDTIIKNKIRKFISRTINESSNDDYSYILEIGEECTPYYVFEMFENKENPWTPLIEPSMYQKALNEFTQYGEIVRFPTKYIYKWMNIIIRNICLLESTTEIAGHGRYWCTDDFVSYYFNDDYDSWNEWKEENGFGDDKDDYGAGVEFLERLGFFDWCKLPDGSDAWSDAGPYAFGQLLNQHRRDFTPEEALVWINKCLDVAHLRGDLASMFIKGGTKTLSQISNGMYVNEQKLKHIIQENISELKNVTYDTRDKVVDKLKQGYLAHGTPETFETFDDAKVKGGFRGEYGFGFYFTNELYKCLEYGTNILFTPKNIYNFLNLDKSGGLAEIVHKYDNLALEISQCEERLYNVNNNREYEYYSKMLEDLEAKVNDPYNDVIIYTIKKGLNEYENRTDENVYKYTLNNIPSNLHKRLAKLLLDNGFDGVCCGNQYCIFNMQKLNQNIIE